MTRHLRAAPALACAAICALHSTSARAQALEPYQVPIWNGVYAGLHAGGNWFEADLDPFASSGIQAGAFGAHVGAMAQFGQLVAGVEADLDYKSGEASASAAFELPDGTPVSGSASSALTASGTIRGRLGVTLLPQLMVYATAGYAWATVDEKASLSIGSDSFRASSGTTLSGIAYGAGLEGFITPNVLLRIEAMRIDYEDISLAPGLKIETSSDVVRAGISWKFN